MDLDSPKVSRRKRRTPQRRVPAVNEERDHKPVFLGYGSDLNHREREALKERIALFAGIGLAIVIGALLGWGLLYDQVIHPAQVRAANNKPIAVVGSSTIRTGLFKRFQAYRQQNDNTQLQQIQGELSQANANPKKNATIISQLQQQEQAIQADQTNLATNTLNSLIDFQVVLQRSKEAGLPITQKLKNAAWTQAIKDAGGRVTLQTVIKQSGLSEPEYRQLNLAQFLLTKLQPALAAKVGTTQLKVRASHILISAKKKSLAEKLYREVKNGAAIAPLAKKYSTDTGSAKKGGDLGFFPHHAMVAPFDKAAFSMKVGEVRLVKSTYGWHIIKVTGREHAKLTAQELQQAKSSAVQTWLDEQKTALHVQRIVGASDLPAIATATPVPGQLPSAPSNVQQPVQIPTQPQPIGTTPANSTGSTGAKHRPAPTAGSKP